MDPLFPARGDKPPIRGTTLEEVRLSLLRDARRSDISRETAHHYRNLAALIATNGKPGH